MAEVTPNQATKGETNSDVVHSAEGAIDRDLSTISFAPWLKLEFDKTYHIEKIVIYCRFYAYWYDPDAWCVSHKSRFEQCVDNTNNVDVSVYQGDVKQGSCGTLQLTYSQIQSKQIYTLVCNIRGDTVKLTKSAVNVNVAEIVVLQKLGKYFEKF